MAAEQRRGQRRKGKKPRLTDEHAQRETELEGLLFGRDEEALQALGQEAKGGAALGSSLSDFLRSYAEGTAGADGREAEGEQEPHVGRGDLPGPLLFEDRRGGGGAEALAAGSEQQQALGDARRRRPVWDDPQDAQVRVNAAARSQLRKLRQAEDEVELSGEQYERRLRQQHNKLHPHTAWASLKKRRQHSAEGSNSEDDKARDSLLQRAGGLLARGAALPPSMLETTRLKDANQADACKGAVKGVEFHHNGKLLLTAGLDRRVRLFTVDGVKNPRAVSWFIEDMPVHKAAFAAGGSKVLVSGRRRFCYLLDVESQAVERLASLSTWRDEKSFESFVTSQHSPQPLAAFFGNEGHVPLLSLQSKQMVGILKMNGTARAGAFSADGTRLFTSGGDGNVYVWDLRTQRCLQRYQDEGCLNGTSMACSHDGALFATGSSSGVVNVYSQQASQQHTRLGAEGEWMLPEAPIADKPLKTVLNLTTTIDTLAFNHDSQMLVLASRLKRDSLKLVHVPTMTVFSNWPTSKSPLHYVHAAGFSPNSGYLAIGNARGRVLLYRLHHYSKA